MHSICSQSSCYVFSPFLKLLAQGPGRQICEICRIDVSNQVTQRDQFGFDLRYYNSEVSLILGAVGDKLLRKPAGRLGVVSPCERSEN